MKRIQALAAAVFALAASTVALAQGFPNKPVKIVVPYPAGGPTDILGRGVAQKLSELWSQPVIVDNRPGANEIIAAEATARAPADGYTLFLASEQALSLNPYLYSKLPYDPEKDFVPIFRIVEVHFALIAAKEFPANNVKELLELARKSPGKVKYGSSGIGGVQHLPMAWLASSNGVDMLHVPYKGLAPTLQDMMAGQLDIVFGAISAALPYITSGKLKALAVSGPTRAKALPDVPTFSQAGLRDFSAGFTMGLVAPAKTPRAVVDKIVADMQKVVEMPDFRAKYVDQFAFDLVSEGPEKYAAFLVKDRKEQAARVRAVGAKLE